jgi:hypothetical protein
VYNVDYTDERSCAVRYRRRPAKNFDSVHISQTDRGHRWIECAAPRHAVDNEEERVEFAKSPKFGNGTGWAGVPAWGDPYASGQSESVAERSHAACPKIVAADNFDRSRDVVRGLGNPGGYDLNGRNDRWRTLTSRAPTDACENSEG